MENFKSTLEALTASKLAVMQVSGGRDSRAMLELIAPHLRPQDVVLMLVTDDMPDESVQYARECEKRFANFRLLVSDSIGDRELYGHPSPIVLSDQPMFANVPRTRTQFSCCYQNIMRPIHEATMEYAPDLILRGQRLSDEHQNPIPHLGVEDGVVYAYPVGDWTTEQVMLYLEDRVPSFYEHCDDAPDCMTCTGYWGRGYQNWLESVAPEMAAVRKERIRSVIQAITPALLLGIQEVI